MENEEQIGVLEKLVSDLKKTVVEAHEYDTDEWATSGCWYVRDGVTYVDPWICVYCKEHFADKETQHSGNYISDPNEKNKT